MAEMTKKELKEARKLEELRRANLEKKASMTKWIIIGAISTVFLGFFLYLVIFLKGSNSNLNNSDTPGQAVDLSDSGQFRVASESTTPASERPVILTEFADIQCPACQQYHPIVKSVLDLYPETVTLNFKHFPIESIHPNATVAAIAAEAAGRQEKFFEMIDLLYERQAAWSGLPNPREQFISYANELKLDIKRFTADLDEDALKGEIDAQRNEGIEAGVNSTPSFYVNGVKIENPGDISGFQAAIDEALKKAGGDAEVSPSTSTPSATSVPVNPQINL